MPQFPGTPRQSTRTRRPPDRLGEWDYGGTGTGAEAAPGQEQTVGWTEGEGALPLPEAIEVPVEALSGMPELREGSLLDSPTKTPNDEK